MATAFEKAMAWKLAYIKDARPGLKEDIDKYAAEERNAANANDRAVAKGLKEDYQAKLKELNEEEGLLDGPAGLNTEKRKALKANLQKRISAAKGVLHGITDGDARLNYIREIEEWDSLLKALIAEGE